MIQRLAGVPGLTFALVFAWKAALLLFTAQPVPANDSFFYDGPVVNFLLNGKYCNPSLALVLPISGNEVFCAYPPLYQLVLLGWMSVLGTSVLSAMWLHFALLALFMLIVLDLFRRLQVPAWCANVAGLFLLSITFHDRPDTLAHVLGALAVWAFVRGWSAGLRPGVLGSIASNAPGWRPALQSDGWLWLSVVLLLLTFSTSVQIGGIYSFWVALLALGATWLGQIKFPWIACATFVAALSGLVGLVKFGFPHLWQGFHEHLTITPAVTDWRVPRLSELLKVARTAPGIFIVLALLGWLAATRRISRERLANSPSTVIAICGAITASVLIAACLVRFTANTIHAANYLQVVIVGCFLAATQSGFAEMKTGRIQTALFTGAVALVSIRAVGMTTWGLACARDVSRGNAIRRIGVELDSVPNGSTVILSSAFLYDAARRTNVNWIHSDWPAVPGAPGYEAEGIARLCPPKLILTQFDYYRRYAAVLGDLRNGTNAPEIQITDMARLRPPDSYPRLQKVVQHVSWAPVIVDLNWTNSPK